MLNLNEYQLIHYEILQPLSHYKLGAVNDDQAQYGQDEQPKYTEAASSPQETYQSPSQYNAPQSPAQYGKLRHIFLK